MALGQAQVGGQLVDALVDGLALEPGQLADRPGQDGRARPAAVERRVGVLEDHLDRALVRGRPAGRLAPRARGRRARCCCRRRGSRCRGSSWPASTCPTRTRRPGRASRRRTGSRSTLTSAGTSWPLWWNVFDTCVDRRAPRRRGRSHARRRRRLDQLAEPIDVVAAASSRPSPTSTTGGTTVRHRSVASWQRSTKTQVGSGVPICGRLPGIVDSGRWRLAHAVARQRAQQAERVRMLRALEDRRRVALLDDLAGVHHADPVAQRPDDAEVVGDQQDRGIGLGLERAHEVEHARLDRRVETGRRLIEDEQLRVGGERDGDDDALLHPARQLVRVALGRPAPGRRSGRVAAALSALASACFWLWPRTVKASTTCGPTLRRRVEGRARVLVDHRGVVHPELADLVVAHLRDVVAGDEDPAAGDDARCAAGSGRRRRPSWTCRSRTRRPGRTTRPARTSNDTPRSTGRGMPRTT